MSVCVDPMLPCRASRRWPWPKSCHMVADSDAELHAMAGRLGLLHGWFQARATLPHYDLTEGKRHQAIRLGAVPLTFAEMRLRLRGEGK